jgi:hypothetical protein
VSRAIIFSASSTRVAAGLTAPLLAGLTLGAAVRALNGSGRVGPRPAALARILGLALRIATGLRAARAGPPRTTLGRILLSAAVRIATGL